MDSLDFIKQVASGDSNLARETLNNIISNVASDALEDRKVNLAATLYNSPVEEEFVQEKAGYSAKAGAAGKDLGKPGKNFSKIEKKAAKEYGSKEAGERVAGAVLNKLRHEEYMPEHVEGDEKELTKGMKMVHKNEPEGSPHTAKVFHNKDWEEYQTHFYKKGRHMGEGPVGYHDNKEDAIEHAGYGVKHFNAGGK